VFEAKWFNKRVEELNAKFDDPKEIMAENIWKVLEKDEKVENLVELAAELEREASVFKNNSKLLKRTIKRKYLWKTVAIALPLVLLL